ncbi:ribonuclease III [Caldicellulosiruptor obsidiansis OB47]|uniref:Mini-ribonuclease 3 n=1 Tax=Caldicellulosiruptor obsidiansis (strain ATCC BAA-2073 / JCM 16842 / OB47) TaxID=608506 RepID=D9TFX5_CALOO|nr:ribonuclease III domain-containing protein [Caldicellulosiruptor obsidiansis]ADL43095.1 ribonuclease III [Caldicellulosiruptor obsidiansis OB47]
MLNPLTYAYIGDAVYEQFIRTKIVEENPNLTPHIYHLRSIRYVKAENQAKAIKLIWDILTEEEKSVAKRGRNAKSKTIPKNADVLDYRFATAFECLIGYLYMNGKNERLYYILNIVYDTLTKERRNQ